MGKELEEPADGEESWEMLMSAQDMVIIHINSQQQWLPAQDQASRNSNMAGGRGPETPRLSKELMAVGGC